jgi:hypothetical protein
MATIGTSGLPCGGETARSGDLTVVPGFGDTPATILVLSSGTDRGAPLGGAARCLVEPVDNERASLNDVHPQLARRTQVALAREFEGSDLPVARQRSAGVRFGRLLPGDGRRPWVV